MKFPSILLLCLLLSAAASAQSPSGQSVSPAESADFATPENQQPSSQERILDEPMWPGPGRKFARIPLYPFIGLGRAMEKGLTAVEEHHLQARMNYSRWRLRQHHTDLLFGGLGSGSGTAFGVNFFDQDFFHPAVRVDVPLWISTRNYQQGEVLLGIRPGAARRFFFELATRYRSRPRERFYGLGPHSIGAARSDYHLQDRGAGFAIGTETAGGSRFDFSVAYSNANVFGGRDNDEPDTGTAFPGLPGLARGSSLLRYGFSAVHPWLDNPLDPQRGLRLRGRLLWAESVNSDPFDFLESGASTDFYIPLGGRRTLAVRGAGEFRHVGSSREIPFYLLPSVGGASTVRGFRAYRFIDRHSIVINAEYRYRIWTRADFVLFSDHGQVAPRVSAFRLENFVHGWGGGVRLKSAKGVAMRFDVGHSREGTRFYFTVAPEF
jgi:outer membrane protein assembly factor BamA